MNDLGDTFVRYGREEVHGGFWWGKVRERGHLEDLGIEGK
jgi:hypothetical protein